MDSGEVYAIVQLGVIGGAVALCIIGASVAGPFVARYWYKAQRAEMELSLKHAMLERGMTAEQICAVIEAGEGAKAPPAPPVSAANDWRQWKRQWKDQWKAWKQRA